MSPWNQRKYGQCAYLVSGTNACCEEVVCRDSPGMTGRYCPDHYERMIDRPGMARASAKRGIHTRSDASNKTPKIKTVWDEGRNA